jgi:signal peptidase II
MAAVSIEGSADEPTQAADSGAAGPSPEQVHPQRWPVLVVIAAVLLIADIVTKVVAVANLRPGHPVNIVGDVVTLTLVRNAGAAFSIATGMTWLLTLIAALVVVGVIRYAGRLRSLWWAVGLGMVLSGALGNLVDRIFRAPGPLRGHVVDFVSIGWWPVFNVADSCIVCGAVLLVALNLFGFEPNGTRRRAAAAVHDDVVRNSA